MTLKNLKKTLRLSFSLANTNFKLRNEGSYLGILWYILSPLAILFILYSVFSKNIGSGVEYYPVYVLFGLVMFNFFSGATGKTTKVIKENAGILKAVKIDSLSIVFAAVWQFVYSHIFEIIILGGFFVYFGIAINNLLIYPLFFVLFFIFVLGTGLVLATIGVFIEDLENIWSIFTTFLFFTTPIFYSLSSQEMPILIKLNPLTHFLVIVRDAVLYNHLPMISTVLKLTVLSLGTLIIGLLIFNLTKKDFAEKV